MISKTIAQIACFHVFELFVAARFGDGEPERALRANTHNACLDSALLNIRCFNEFLKAGGRTDDLRAHHSKGVNVQPFLSPNEEVEINKWLAHITQPRVNAFQKPWDLDDMVIRGLRAGADFLSQIEVHFPIRCAATQAESQGVRKAISRILPQIANRSHPPTENKA